MYLLSLDGGGGGGGDDNGIKNFFKISKSYCAQWSLHSGKLIWRDTSPTLPKIFFHMNQGCATNSILT